MQTFGNSHKHGAIGFAAVIIWLTLFPGVALATKVQDHIRDRVELIRKGFKVTASGSRLASRIVLPALYEKQNFRPLWKNPYSVDQLFSVLESIDREGLNPADYHLPKLKKLRQRLQANSDAQTQGDYDLLLTDALLRLGYHLQFGKVDPAALDSSWNIDRKLDRADYILKQEKAIRRGAVKELIVDMTPLLSISGPLNRAFQIYRAIQARGGWPVIPNGPTLRLGVTDKRVIRLRERLGSTGDILAGNLYSELYDHGVKTAVSHFQRRHGLPPDGVVGGATLKALNVPVKARVNQIRANLERARWVLPVLPDEFVLVDITGFSLTYIKHGKIAWETKVQVGKAYRETPVFRAEIKYLMFNPTWTVPPTILKEDVLPAIKRDPRYLQRRNLKVIDHKGNHVDASGIDWSKYSERNFPYSIRQEAGPGNALGRIKFVLPNKHSIYLHDTPSKALFGKKKRASSSGCVRVQYPYRLAELLLDDPQNWSVAKIKKGVNAGKTRRVKLSKPVTVVFMYWTVRMDSDGGVLFRNDIYGRDRAIVEALKKPFKFRRRPILNAPAPSEIRH